MESNHVIIGIFMLILGIAIFVSSLRYNETAMAGLKFRGLLTGIVAIVVGLVVLFS